MPDATFLLNNVGSGDPHAAELLLPLVYDDLRRLAAHRLGHEAPGQTLQPTALVHEAYLRLVGEKRVGWAGRAHFFAADAAATCRILVENACFKASLKRGGHRARLPLARCRRLREVGRQTAARRGRMGVCRP
jgi:RNA polymerase sigma factor (TIGR02999 family)